MELEPLPKVTFLPAQLTELVIKNWTGDIIDYEKNGQVRDYLTNIHRSVKYIMAKEHVNSERDTHLKESLSMVSCTARESSFGLMALNIRENSEIMK